ncbi:MAG: hypothetical protein DYG92_12885 [Leptolyngbya sp. PLA1]|nr:hypothetical protein [Leptolyngbya sp. PLA1]
MWYDSPPGGASVASDLISPTSTAVGLPEATNRPVPIDHSHVPSFSLMAAGSPVATTDSSVIPSTPTSVRTPPGQPYTS